MNAPSEKRNVHLSVKTKMPRKGIIIGVIAIICIIVISLFLILVVFKSESTSEGVITGDTDKIQVVSHEIHTLYGSRPVGNDWVNEEYKEIWGVIKNIADHTIDEVTLTVKFYDRNNSLLHTETDTIPNLAEGETSPFIVSYQADEPYYEQYDESRGSYYTINISVKD